MRRHFIALMMLLAVSLYAHAQRESFVVFTQTDTSLGLALQTIEYQTGYRLTFSRRDLNPNRIIHVPKGRPVIITDALRWLLADTGCTFILYENHVLIFRQGRRQKELPPVNPPQEQPEEQLPPTPVPLAPPAIPQPQPEGGLFLYPSQTKALNRKAGDDSSLSALRPYYNHIFPLLYLKTDLLYDGLGLTPNLSLEIGTSRRTTLDLTLGYNPWNRTTNDEANKKFVHLLAKAEWRYWLCERFYGHFLGFHLLYSSFNIGNLDIPLMHFHKEYRYQGDGYGAGISYGYLWNWTPHWGMEFNVGGGVVWRKYGRYDCIKCGEKIDDKKDFYYGPTSVGIKLIYKLK